ncbi:hypothetical protein N9Z30_06265 [Pseudomonadales bacterium]|nr:hypothetical protein [Pseudomonadales bacterium]
MIILFIVDLFEKNAGLPAKSHWPNFCLFNKHLMSGEQSVTSLQCKRHYQQPKRATFKRIANVVIAYIALSMAFDARSDAFTLDVDANGKTEPLTDGLLIIRHLFGFEDDTLTTNAIGADAQRSDGASIEAYLLDHRSLLDVDADGEVGPLTDGLLIIRHLFGFSDDALIAGVFPVSATRSTADSVKDYLGTLIDTDNDGLLDSVDPFPFDKLNGYSELTESSWSCASEARGPSGGFQFTDTGLVMTLEEEVSEQNLKLEIGLACSPDSPDECLDQGYQLLEKRRLVPSTVVGNEVSFDLVAPTHKRFELKVEAIYKNCTAVLTDSFRYASGLRENDAFLLPEGISINEQRYAGFELPAPSAAPLVLAGFRSADGTGYSDPPAWNSSWSLLVDRGRLFEGDSKLKIGLFGDLTEIHWKLAVELIELLHKIAPDLEADFADNYGEITLPVFIQVCEDWEQNSSFSKCENRSKGELNGSPPEDSYFIYVDVTGYNNPGFYGNFPTIRHEFGHALGLQHHLCSGGQMPVNEMRPQTLSFSLKELAMIALIHDDRFPTGSDKSFDQTREALGIIMDDNVQAYLDDPDLVCEDSTYDQAWGPLWNEYQRNAVIDSGTALSE